MAVHNWRERTQVMRLPLIVVIKHRDILAASGAERGAMITRAAEARLITMIMNSPIVKRRGGDAILSDTRVIGNHDLKILIQAGEHAAQGLYQIGWAVAGGHDHADAGRRFRHRRGIPRTG